MNIHPFMAEAIFLRDNPDFKIEKDTGVILWFDPNEGKYFWRNPKSKTFNRIYEAKGLQDWYNQYLKMIDDSEEDCFE